MVAERLTVEETVEDVSLLASPLRFPCGRVARNRFLKAALTERVSTYSPADPKSHGLPSESIINMYSKWGHGGFGLILTGNVIVDPLHLESAGNIIVSHENDSPELRNRLKRYAAACKADGALAVVQLSHGGRQTADTVNPHPKSASDVQLTIRRRGHGFGKPTPFTEAEIQTEIIDRFVFAAKVCKEAGFDGVQLHGAHGYLLAQFMSPTTNKRTDRYGGPPENRVRIVLDIFHAIRKEIPASEGFVVGVKMNSVEFQDEGLETSDAKIMCALMEEVGVDFVEMSGGTYEKLAFQHMRDSTRAREAFFLDFTDQIRNVFKSTKMYVTGGFRTVPGMLSAVSSGSCDGIGLGRPITAEPDLPKKILQCGVQSAADTKLDQQDYAITNVASNTQMWQAGLRPLDKCLSPSDDVIDLSFPDKAERYKSAVPGYVAHVVALGEAGKAAPGVFEYREEN